MQKLVKNPHAIVTMIALLLLSVSTVSPAKAQGEGLLADSLLSDPSLDSVQEVQTVELGTLSPQELETGQCGLFLWTNASEPRLVFASLNDGNASMIINGENLEFTRSAAEGQEHYGQFELQSFIGADMSVKLNMVIERRTSIVDGAAIPSATLRVTEASGWETVVPVGGLIGCGTA